ncbi:DUF4105 domain-containing protein [Mangrovimonas sp. AS39]|uniref:lipoprotein N-acyltransferase Lnb domain-containing protein n=1 Tax=Mangrovimonas futianensis TaxID=2895523 RepID=UPI001E4C984E|nr:DUF4105 domain-containing protein [Mangrovimonas futianensis]MCF1191210.1 DUF4105 domain-containing protein [Mangrovimonas futianensis]MCF1194905.1 DUF4105 domain-containing protein [Mangrovimonas futianensis]
MLKKLLVTLIFLPLLAFSQEVLSPEAEISVLTVGPGNNLNDAFGHNAFRVKDPSQGLDVTFDYGRYDFNAPNFYLKFAQGKLDYAIGKTNYSDFLGFYIWQKRTVREQVLNLKPIQKEALYKFLEHNYQPENRNYKYDFFYDNCATKIKDVLVKAQPEKIKFEKPTNYEPQTFRTLIQRELHWNTWGSLGIDIALGSVIDQMATPEEQMFLPKYIHAYFEKAQIGNQPLVKEEKTVYQAPDKVLRTSFWVSPMFIFSIIALFILFQTYKNYTNQSRSRYLDTFIFVLTGFIGLVLLLLWLATDHSATAANYNLLWAFPLNLLIWPQLLSKQPKPWLNRYLKFLIIMLCLMGLHWIIGVQRFALSLIPLVFALAIRYVYLIKSMK